VGAWDIGASIVAVIAGCFVVLLAVGCVWPLNQPRRSAPAHRRDKTRCQLRPVQWPQAWTCDLPTRPLTLADAHRALQLHREHDCARKRAAFATLVAAGRITPDSSRQQNLWRKFSEPD
jgi:hypothetical protein